VVADRTTGIAKLGREFLGAFAKLRTATISFVMSARLSARDISAPTGRIFIKSDICVFFENLFCEFKVCKSVHHRTIQIQLNHLPDATILQFIILTFIYSSTCFGRFRAHHQELNDCSGSLWEAATAVVELLMMGGKMPETC